MDSTIFTAFTLRLLLLIEDWCEDNGNPTWWTVPNCEAGGFDIVKIGVAEGTDKQEVWKEVEHMLDIGDVSKNCDFGS